MSPHDQQLLQELHARAQMAELERDTALRELEQLRRDNQLFLEKIEDLRAQRERLAVELEQAKAAAKADLQAVDAQSIDRLRGDR